MSFTRRPLHSGAVLALVCGAQFMLILDLAIVNVAIPSMQADLGLSQADLQWVVITYGLALGGFVLLGGREADLFGRRRMLVGGLTLFSAASLSAGLAESLAQLVVSRGVQGIGAAMALPAALSILTGTFPEGAARNKALGIFAAVSGSAASVGVIAGGLFTEGPGGSADVANALTEGFQRASLTAAGFSTAAALAAGVLLRRAERARTPSGIADHRPTVLAVSDEFPG